MRVLDLFCGRLGWSKAFLARGWEAVGVDLVEPPEIPAGFTFIKADALDITLDYAGLRWNKFGPGKFITKCRFVGGSIDGYPELCDACGKFYEDDVHKPLKFDFACASSPCENFTLFRMAHFHPKPPYPELGIKLFNHSRGMLEAAGIPYIMENVAGAEDFVGRAVHHCGSFYLWGTAVPPLIPKGIRKGIDVGSSKAVKGMTKEEKRVYRSQFAWNQAWSSSEQRKRDTAKVATIPPELANCVADYAERLLEVTNGKH